MPPSTGTILISKKEFETIYLEHYERLYGLAFTYLKEMEEAKEVVQQVFAKLYEKLPKLEITQSLDGYLNTAVRNTCLNELKRKRPDVELEEQTEEEHFDETYHLEQAEEELRIWKAIEALPPKCKRIFMLSRFDQMKNAEIAEQLDISKRTVETQISLALKNLRAKLLSLLFSGVL